MTKMSHPESRGSIEVRPDQVEMYESQGWAEVKPPAKPAADKPNAN